MKAIVLGFCLMSMLMLSGCKVSSNSGSNAAGFTSTYATEGSGPGETDPGNGIVQTRSNPEPATMALMGTGLAAYAFFKRKKKNKK